MKERILEHGFYISELLGGGKFAFVECIRPFGNPIFRRTGDTKNYKKSDFYEIHSKIDPETWETRLTQFEEMKTALEKIVNIEEIFSLKFALDNCKFIAQSALASLTENNGNENLNKGCPFDKPNAFNPTKP